MRFGLIEVIGKLGRIAIQVEVICACRILVVFDNGEKSALMLNHI